MLVHEDMHSSCLMIVNWLVNMGVAIARRDDALVCSFGTKLFGRGGMLEMIRLILTKSFMVAW